MPASAPLRLLAAALLALAAGAAVPSPAAGAAPRPVVAVLDTGAALGHPALRGLAWRNPGEIAGNGADDDGNGFVDDVHGADFVDGDGRPADPRGHGTHVAGLIARRGRRLRRPSGARIMVLRVMGRDGRGESAHLAQAIGYAVDHGARVVNLSVGGYGPDPAVEAALERAAQAGVLVVAAAGNGYQNLNRTPVYPASFRTSTMLVVAASFGGRLESWSARGSRTVDIAAPGTDLRSALPGGRYGRRTGTSQAAAIVSRAAARALVRRPRATTVQVREALLAGVRAVPGLSAGVASGGVLDLRSALGLLRR